jgi:hypothetical protein
MVQIALLTKEIAGKSIFFSFYVRSFDEANDEICQPLFSVTVWVVL